MASRSAGSSGGGKGRSSPVCAPASPRTRASTSSTETLPLAAPPSAPASTTITEPLSGAPPTPPVVPPPGTTGRTPDGPTAPLRGGPGRAPSILGRLVVGAAALAIGVGFLLDNL